MIRKAEIAGYISKYLQEREHAGDTPEGIAKWWVMSRQLDVSIWTVQQALEQLEASGIVVEKKGLTPCLKSVFATGPQLSPR
jgi:hypothetical protein